MRPPNKILVIRFSSIGDILLSTPLLRSLKSTFPEARIDYLTKSEHAELVRGNPAVSHVIELASGEFGELSLLRKRIASERYDLLIDLHNSLRSRYIRALSRARRRRVVRKHAFARAILVRFRKNFYRRIDPVPQRYLATVSGLGVRDDGGGLEVFIPEETRARITALVSKNQSEKYPAVIGFVPGARHFTKRWPAERFVELGTWFIRNFHARIMLFGGKEESDLSGDIAHLINTNTSTGSAESFAGSLTLLETAAAMDHCRLVVSNDTGLMHLAAARRKPVVALFGSSVKEFGFAPYGVPSVVVEKAGLACRPCSPIGAASCHLGHFNCMMDLHPTDVIAASERLIGKQTGSVAHAG